MLTKKADKGRFGLFAASSCASALALAFSSALAFF